MTVIGPRQRKHLQVAEMQKAFHSFFICGVFSIGLIQKTFRFSGVISIFHLPEKNKSGYSMLIKDLFEKHARKLTS